MGYNFSTPRPRGGRARTTGMVASGPVSLLHVWDAMPAGRRSAVSRRSSDSGAPNHEPKAGWLLKSAGRDIDRGTQTPPVRHLRV